MTISTLHVRHEKRQPTHTLTHAHTLYFLSLCLSLCCFSSLLFEEKGTAARERVCTHTHAHTGESIQRVYILWSTGRGAGTAVGHAAAQSLRHHGWLSCCLRPPVSSRFGRNSNTIRTYCTHMLYCTRIRSYHALLTKPSYICSALGRNPLTFAVRLEEANPQCTVMGDMSDMS